jgi:predicted Zn-dependent protease
MTRLRMRALALVALLIGLPVAAGAQSDTDEPVAAPYDSGLPDDFELGLEVSTALAKTIGVVDSTVWRQKLSEIGYRVAAMGHASDAHYSFAVLDLPEPNAIALPGGFLFVTRGMMAMGISDDELAHLLGHEISHIELGHHARAARVSTVLSLARTALLIGVLMGARDDGRSTERAEVSDDPGRRDWAVGLTGKEALVQASSIFGEVLQALLERGYSRGYEYEADEGGDRLSVAAGFAPAAGVTLLEKLHERSFEDNAYSYWRTHPYFEDRVARARVRATRHHPPVHPPDDTAYRQQQALFFAQAADRVRDEDQALQLLQRALDCEPGHIASLATGLELARFKERRVSKLPPILRGYGPLVADYDSLITRAQTDEPQWPELDRARAARDSLVSQRDRLLAEYEQGLAESGSSTGLLERFIENYPAHPRVTETKVRLGVHLLLAGRAVEAIDRLLPLVADSSVGAWSDSALATVLRAIPEVNELSACYHLQEAETLRGAGAAALQIEQAARQRMDDLVAADVSLDQGGRFLASHPDTPWSGTVREKVVTRAQQAYLTGRVQEGMQRYQEALDAYFEVLAFAADSPAAAQAVQGVERINRLEKLN